MKTERQTPEEKETLSNKVFQAIGQASMCWETLSHAGIFDDKEATKIAEKLLQDIKDQHNNELKEIKNKLIFLSEENIDGVDIVELNEILNLLDKHIK